MAMWLSLLTHALLDALTGFSPILWPMLEDEVYVEARIGAAFQHSVELKPVFQVHKRPGNSTRFRFLDATAFTAEGGLVSGLLLTLSLLKFVTRP